MSVLRRYAPALVLVGWAISTAVLRTFEPWPARVAWLLLLAASVIIHGRPGRGQ